MSAVALPAARPVARAPWRSVALPAEHGGWGLTLEPGLLGLLVAPSVAGLCIALGAMVAFLARTPLKIAAVDRRRGRVLERTRSAQRVAAGELVVLAGLALAAVRLGAPWFWVPGVAALPLLAVEASFEVRSRGRRLVPELAGAVAICSVAAMVALADGRSGAVATGLWFLLAARVATSIPHVRAQIARLHGRPSSSTVTLAGDLAAMALSAIAIGLDRSLVSGAMAIGAVIVVQRRAELRAVPRPVVLGMRQMAMGLAVVGAAAMGVLVLAT
jgi:hypothetical protein